MNIIFDLDGTLINSKVRLYKLFKSLAPATALSFSQYWDLKQNKITNQIILSEKLGFAQQEIAQFVEKWMVLIESPEFLACDSCIPNVHHALARLKPHANLYICTARQHSQSTLEQLAHFDLLHFFARVLVTEQKCSKERMIRQHVSSIDCYDWIVGDMGKDIQDSKALNIKSCAVLSGFLNRTSLLAYEPDLVLNSVADFSPEYLASSFMK